MNAQFNWSDMDVCGSGCYELLMLAKPETQGLDLELRLKRLIGYSNQALEDLLGKVVIPEEGVRIPAVTYSKYYPGSQTWVIELNKYHRDNLLWLFNVCGYPWGHGVDPFTFANTGDWAGEIPNMLSKPGQNCLLDQEDYPNKSIQELRNQINNWLKANEK